MISTCQTCNHENNGETVHEPGACKNCNCGESGIRHITSETSYRFDVPEFYNTDMYAWADRFAEMVYPERRLQQR